jgi:hypothetical protein
LIYAVNFLPMQQALTIKINRLVHRFMEAVSTVLDYDCRQFIDRQSQGMASDMDGCSGLADSMTQGAVFSVIDRLGHGVSIQDGSLGSWHLDFPPGPGRAKIQTLPRALFIGILGFEIRQSRSGAIQGPQDERLMALLLHQADQPLQAGTFAREKQLTPFLQVGLDIFVQGIDLLAPDKPFEFLSAPSEKHYSKPGFNVDKKPPTA